MSNFLESEVFHSKNLVVTLEGKFFDSCDVVDCIENILKQAHFEKSAQPWLSGLDFFHHQVLF